MDTAPLPRVPPDAEPARARGGLRGLEAAAGLASGGLLTIGLGLVVLQLLAPEIAPGSGLSAPVGPTWWRALGQLAVGLLGEGAVALRSRLPRSARTWLAAVVLIAVLVTLYVAWLA